MEGVSLQANLQSMCLIDWIHLVITIYCTGIASLSPCLFVAEPSLPKCHRTKQPMSINPISSK